MIDTDITSISNTGLSGLPITALFFSDHLKILNLKHLGFDADFHSLWSEIMLYSLKF